MGSEPLQKEQFFVSGDVCLEYKRYLCVLLFLFCFSSAFHSLCGMPAGSGRTQDTVLLSFYFQQIFFLARNKCGEMRTRTVLPESCYTLWMTN